MQQNDELREIHIFSSKYVPPYNYNYIRGAVNSQKAERK
jgi:hypothetical protein